MLLNSKLACIFISKSGRKIMPGNNIVPDEEGETLIKSPEIAEKIAINLFAIGEDVKAPETFGDEKLKSEDKAARVIANHPEEKTLEIIEELLDIHVLRALLKVEKRQNVLLKINEKIELLTKEDKKKDKF